MKCAVKLIMIQGQRRKNHLAQGLAHDFEGASEATGLGSKVEADAALVSEECSIREEKAGVFECFAGVLGFKISAVEPCEIGCFDVRDFDRRERLGKSVDEKVAVFAEVGEEVLTPRLAVLVSGFCGVIGEAVDLRKRVSFSGGEAAADGVVRNYSKSIT